MHAFADADPRAAGEALETRGRRQRGGREDIHGAACSASSSPSSFACSQIQIHMCKCIASGGFSCAHAWACLCRFSKDVCCATCCKRCLVRQSNACILCERAQSADESLALCPLSKARASTLYVRMRMYTHYVWLSSCFVRASMYTMYRLLGPDQDVKRTHILKHMVPCFLFVQSLM